MTVLALFATGQAWCEYAAGWRGGEALGIAAVVAPQNLGPSCRFHHVKRAFMLVWRGLVAYRLGA